MKPRRRIRRLVDPAFRNESSRRTATVAQLGQLLTRTGLRASHTLSEDLGIDTLARIDLALSVERAWGIALSDRTISEWQTIGDVACAILDCTEMEAA